MCVRTDLAADRLKKILWVLHWSVSSERDGVSIIRGHQVNNLETAYIKFKQLN